LFSGCSLEPRQQWYPDLLESALEWHLSTADDCKGPVHPESEYIRRRDCEICTRVERNLASIGLQQRHPAPVVDDVTPRLLYAANCSGRRNMRAGQFIEQCTPTKSANSSQIKSITILSHDFPVVSDGGREMSEESPPGPKGRPVLRLESKYALMFALSCRKCAFSEASS
jgi:hypothetical protein